MRIAYLADYRPFRGAEMVRTEAYITQALRSLGHEVLQVQVPPYWFRRRIRSFRPDIILVSHCRKMPRSWIEALPQENPGSLVAQWIFDALSAESLRHLDRERSWFIPRGKRWHISFLKERGRFPYYESLGIRCHWLHQAAPDFPFAETYDAEHACDVAFLGNPHSPYRIEVLRRLQAEGYRVHVYSDRSTMARWRRAGVRHVFPPMCDEAMAPVCASARFILGVGCGPRECEGYWSNRVYMTLAHGGLMVHQYVPGLEEHFENGRHLLWWRNVEELVALLRRFRDDEAARRRIRAAGHEHVRRRHTYERRCAEFVEVCRSLLDAGRRADAERTVR